MIDENPSQERKENIVLYPSSSEKIDRWFEQIMKKKKVKLSRKEFVNWLIEKLPDNLSNGDLGAIIDRFYDAEAFLRQLLRDVKKTKAEGGADPTIDLVVRTKKIEQNKEPEETDDGDPELLDDGQPS